MLILENYKYKFLYAFYAEKERKITFKFFNWYFFNLQLTIMIFHKISEYTL